MTVDPIALRVQLEQQIAQLVPIAQRLQGAATHPPVAPADWNGPASASYGRLEAELRARVADSVRAVEGTIAATRSALGVLDG